MEKREGNWGSESVVREREKKRKRECEERVLKRMSEIVEKDKRERETGREKGSSREEN